MIEGNVYRWDGVKFAKCEFASVYRNSISSHGDAGSHYPIYPSYTIKAEPMSLYSDGVIWLMTAIKKGFIFNYYYLVEIRYNLNHRDKDSLLKAVSGFNKDIETIKRNL